MNAVPWLTLLTILPAVGAVLLLLMGNGNAQRTKLTSAAFAFGALLISCWLWHAFNLSDQGMQFAERHLWIPALNIEYHLGIDGLGLLMLMLSSIVTLIAIAASWKIAERVSLYFALVLLLESCLFGAFTALSFMHWFMFWELCLIPAFFLIKLWGGSERTPAATQFLVYTMAGSVAMLLSFIALYLATGSFDFIELAQLAHRSELMPAVAANSSWAHMSSQHIGLLLFGGVFLGLAVKVPVVPFHTWLPAAYSEAPTGTTILLTGAMSKMGLYGFLRLLLPIFAPQMRSLSTPLLWLAVATVVLGSFSALAQKDLKRVFAYSSINHLGYCILGIVSVVTVHGADTNLLSQRYAAVSGTLLQMFSHGLTAAMIFWFIALLEERSGGLRKLQDFGGLRKVAPVFAGLMGIALFSSLGLPGLNGFIGEFLIFKGSFPLAGWSTSLSLIGLLITAVFILKVIQKVFAGPLNERWTGFADLTGREQLLIAPAIALMFLIGLYPQMLLSHINSTVVQIVQMIPF
jgi:NADH-quinone oxidoreductase subunit M